MQEVVFERIAKSLKRVGYTYRAGFLDSQRYGGFNIESIVDLG
jgi:hypothetical protein